MREATQFLAETDTSPAERRYSCGYVELAHVQLYFQRVANLTRRTLRDVSRPSDEALPPLPRVFGIKLRTSFAPEALAAELTPHVPLGSSDFPRLNGLLQPCPLLPRQTDEIFDDRMASFQ